MNSRKIVRAGLWSCFWNSSLDFAICQWMSCLLHGTLKYLKCNITDLVKMISKVHFGMVLCFPRFLLIFSLIFYIWRRDIGENFIFEDCMDANRNVYLNFKVFILVINYMNLKKLYTCIALYFSSVASTPSMIFKPSSLLSNWRQKRQLC